MLSEAGWLDGLADGYLHIEGQYDDATAGSPLDGFLKMGPFRLQQVTPRPNIGTLNSTAVNPTKTDFDALLVAAEKVRVDLLALGTALATPAEIKVLT